jgi:uncharacterized membrane protein YuzA (DUF378 family)
MRGKHHAAALLPTMNPLTYLKQAQKQYPQLRLAWGLVGIAAAAAMISALLSGRSGLAVVVILVLAIAGMFVLSSLARTTKQSPFQAGSRVSRLGLHRGLRRRPGARADRRGLRRAPGRWPTGSFPALNLDLFHPMTPSARSSSSSNDCSSN